MNLVSFNWNVAWPWSLLSWSGNLNWSSILCDLMTYHALIHGHIWCTHVWPLTFPIMDIGQHSHFMHGRHIIRSNCVLCKSLTSRVKPYLHACKPQCVPHLLYCLSCRHVVKISRMSTLWVTILVAWSCFYFSLSLALSLCVYGSMCAGVQCMLVYRESMSSLVVLSGPICF